MIIPQYASLEWSVVIIAVLALFPAVAISAMVAAIKRRILICSLLALFLAFVRLFLVLEGFANDPDAVRGLDLVVASILLMVAWAARDRLAQSVSPEQRISVLAAALALPLAAYGLLSGLAPPVSAQAQVQACSGAAIGGSNYQGLTTAQGLNARTGPGTIYPQARRFGSNCQVGFDGYCVGEGIGDSLAQLPDVRWLAIRHTDIFAAAGAVFPLSADQELGSAPQPDCPGGLPEPSLAAEPIIDPSATGFYLTLAPRNTQLVGVSLYYGESDTMPALVEPLGEVPKMTNGSGTATAEIAVDSIRASAADRTDVRLAVVPCLAPLVPSHSPPSYYALDLGTGALTPTDAPGAGASREQLAQAACRVNPALGSDRIVELAQARSGPNA